ncbi:HAMP domain-containing histidine kinase [Iamia sp. SCSIO 61187]|uniref:sensor histidine kinase n=1 Tax=Iamia sp. SCSIO 61187 TaxID=2722752 RepID=UPI001C634060|nr:HAMP domain-containing sensor histidine kinase [Iamia sp. SCSIO 61187]QYG93211.1 HAMP domain-containing histidine kinase [Iamia sp. SCSIO 61187]
MGRPRGLSARMKLTLSYAGLVVVAGVILLAVVRVFLLRYVPDHTIVVGPLDASGQPGRPGPHVPSRSDLERAFTPRALQALALLLVLGLVGGWTLAGRMLAPLRRITQATRLAATGSLGHRIQLEGRTDELRELADAFDAMLEQLEAHVAEQQRFAANASHELRTPLAISQTLLEVARQDPTRDQGELIERLHTVNARAIDLTEALLLLSRSDRRSFTREPVDLSLIAEEVAEALLPLAEERGATLDVTGEPTPTVASRALLLRMVTNLVQNAVVHNLPDGGTVTVHTEPQEGAAVLRVENTGRPVSPELLPTLTEPFQRGTERVRTDAHVGVGLGLAIVHSIVTAHDGTLDLTPRPGGGLVVTVVLG